jgi:hypothetical protein
MLNKYKKYPNLLYLGLLLSASATLGDIAQAETSNTTVNTNESSLIRAIADDPIMRMPLDNATSAATQTAQNTTSVSQLSDVKPTDWAFTALQSLVERYGCIAGYPDGTYRGKQATTRYEFAAGLNACMDKINEIISAGLSDKVSKEDLATLQKLQEEFSAELATLRGRVDALDAKTAKLEAQQFSTTTKLYGQAIFALQGRLNNNLATSRGGAVTAPDIATNTTFGGLVNLTLATQFENRSLLITGLQAGNISTGATTFPSAFNNSFTRLAYEGNTSNAFQLSDLNYRFYIGDRFAVIVGPKGVNATNVFRGANRIESAGSGPISAFAQRNPIISMNAGDAGIGFDWQIAKDWSLQGVYSAGSSSDTATPATPNSGLFGGPTTIGVQLAAVLAKRVDATLYYLNSYTNNSSLNTAIGDNQILLLPDTSLSTNAFGGSLSWRATNTLNIGGWLGLTSSTTLNNTVGTVTTFNWMSYVNLVDTFKRGDLLGLYIGQPPTITSSNLTAGSTPNASATTTHLELFYRYPISSNISITPGLLFIFNSNNSASSSTITIGALRTTFTF